MSCPCSWSSSAVPLIRVAYFSKNPISQARIITWSRMSSPKVIGLMEGCKSQTLRISRGVIKRIQPSPPFFVALSFAFSPLDFSSSLPSLFDPSSSGPSVP